MSFVPENERIVPMPSNHQANYWIVVGSPENFAKTRDLGFTILGLKSRHRKKAERMRPGDKIAYYITGRKAFAGISTVTSEYFESHEPIWKSKDPAKAAEDYPFRVRTEPELILDEDEFADAEPAARQMEYVSRFQPEYWTLAFQGNVHEVSRGDFDVIRRALTQKSVAEGVGAR
jgi:EVE domain